MKNNPNHGNRLRPPDEAYEMKKKRGIERNARTQLSLNPLWSHNKNLRELVNLFYLNSEIPLEEFINREFDIDVYKSEIIANGYIVRTYDTYGVYILKNKNVCICKM